MTTVNRPLVATPSAARNRLRPGRPSSVLHGSPPPMRRQFRQDSSVAPAAAAAATATADTAW